MIWGLLLFTGLIIVLEGSSLVKNKLWQELTLVIFLVVISVIYGVDFELGLDILPNPNIVLFKLKPLADAFAAFVGV